MTTHFVEAWRAAHPGDTIITRDLATTRLPAITDDWMATYRDQSLWTSAQREYLALSDELIGNYFNLVVGTDIDVPVVRTSRSAQRVS